MTDSVFSEDLLIRSTDSSSFTMTARRFGPAGVLRLQLADGIVVAVDAAKPGQLAFLDVSVGSTGDLLVNELIGGDGAKRLTEMSPVIGGRPERIERSVDASRDIRFGSVPDPGDAAEFVGEMIRLLVISEMSAKSAIVRLVAALEVLRRLQDLSQFPNLGDLFRLRARRALRSLRRDLPLLVEGYEELDDDHRQRLVALLARVRDGGPEVEAMKNSELFLRTSSRSQLSSSRATSHESTGRRHKDRPPQILAIERTEPNWITLKFDLHRKNHWVRVIDSQTQQLVSLVPVKEESRRGSVADVLIPVDHVDAQLAFEVTMFPLSLTDDPVDGQINAVRLGFKAVDMNQRGCRDEARMLWLTCAEQWARLGDLQRSRLALDYAKEGIAKRYRSLADRIDRSSHFEP